VIAALFAALALGAPCDGSALRGTFSVVPGSAGAGNIVYRLRVVNRSSESCWVSGQPRVELLDAKGRKLPTAAHPQRPGVAAAALIALAPGKAASASARFSPDVPGPGEPTTGRLCEPTAYRLRVRPNGQESVVVPIVPPTPVCEHGSLALSLWQHA
jgi:Protein of unknown function (DUF4232)